MGTTSGRLGRLSDGYPCRVPVRGGAHARSGRRCRLGLARGAAAAVAARIAIQRSLGAAESESSRMARGRIGPDHAQRCCHPSHHPNHGLCCRLESRLILLCCYLAACFTRGAQSQPPCHGATRSHDSTAPIRQHGCNHDSDSGQSQAPTDTQRRTHQSGWAVAR